MKRRESILMCLLAYALGIGSLLSNAQQQSSSSVMNATSVSTANSVSASPGMTTPGITTKVEQQITQQMKQETKVERNSETGDVDVQIGEPQVSRTVVGDVHVDVGDIDVKVDVGDVKVDVGDVHVGNGFGNGHGFGRGNGQGNGIGIEPGGVDVQIDKELNDEWRREYPEQETETIRNSYPIDTKNGVHTIEVNNVFGSVKVVAGSSDKVELVVNKTIRGINKAKIEIARKQVTLDVDDKDGTLLFYVNGPFRCNSRSYGEGDDNGNKCDCDCHGRDCG